MPAAETVVADTSPLLNLALIDELELVERRWETVTVPNAVWAELSAGEAGLDALRSLRDRGDIEVVDVEHSDLYVQLRRELDRGEAAAITLALDAGADVLLLDEREARRCRASIRLPNHRRYRCSPLGRTPRGRRARSGPRRTSIGWILDRRRPLRAGATAGRNAIGGVRPSCRHAGRWSEPSRSSSSPRSIAASSAAEHSP